MTPTPAQAATAAADQPPHPLELVRELVATFGPDFDAEEEVSGADAVEWMCDFVNRARISAGFWRSRERAYLAAIQAFHAAAANYSRGGDGRAVRAVGRLDASVRERRGAPLLPRPGDVAAPSPADLLDRVIAAFGPALDEGDEINGGDTVEWLGEFLPAARVVIRRYPDALLTST